MKKIIILFKIIYEKISKKINIIIFQLKWRKDNKHNNTRAKTIFPKEIVSIGNHTYGQLYIKSFGNPREKLSIGSFCSIAGNTVFLLGGEHEYGTISTFPFKKFICNIKENTLTKGPIVIKDDVWIGYNCTILSGITIGQGAIIAAGSVVYKDIPPYAIYGNGKVIKYRFSQSKIDQLLKIDFSKIDSEFIRENLELFYSKFNEINIEETNLIYYMKGYE